MKKLTQKKTILIWLKDHGSITARQAFQSFDCLCLASCIYTLRKQGYAIITERVGCSRFARYHLKSDKGAINE
jgi:hypothetical protein